MVELWKLVTSERHGEANTEDGLRLDWLHSAFVLLGRRMCITRLVVVHDPVMFGLDEVLEVGFDRLDRVLLTNEICRLLADHHLRGVRIAAHGARDDGRVSHTQTFDTSHAETVSTSTSPNPPDVCCGPSLGVTQTRVGHGLGLYPWLGCTK